MRQPPTPCPRSARRAAALLLAAALAVGVPLAASPAAAQAAAPCVTPGSFAGGCGTAANPYLISTPEGVDAIRQNLSAHYKLLNDIDLTPLDVPGVGWQPIGVVGHIIVPDQFLGSLDGRGHTISGVWAGTVNYYVPGSPPGTDILVTDGFLRFGLFGHAGASAVISNLGVTGGDHIDALGEYAGTAEAWQHEITATALTWANSGTITNCWTTGGRDPSIHDPDHFGGAAADGGNQTLLAVYNGGVADGDPAAITGSHNAGNVGGLVGDSGMIGGLVAYNSGSITNSYATGDVTAQSGLVMDHQGGLVGDNAGRITNSYATGDVIGLPGIAFDTLGGLVGENGGHIDTSHATGNVIAPDGARTGPIGGLVGMNITSAPAIGQITNSYATGDVTRLTPGCPFFRTGQCGTGGLVGYSDGSISDSYATGRVTGYSHYTAAGIATTDEAGYDELDGVGGLVGHSAGTILRSYATGPVTGGLHAGGLAGYQLDTSSVTGSFFDTGTTGLTDGVGEKYRLADGSLESMTLLGGDPTGGLRAAAITQSAFADAGWDFATTWTMPTCGAWPVLQGQDPPAGPGCTAPAGLSAVIAQFVALLRDLLTRLLALLPLFAHR